MLNVAPIDLKGGNCLFTGAPGGIGTSVVAHTCKTEAAVISYAHSKSLALGPYKISVDLISSGVIDAPIATTVKARFAKLEGEELGQKKREVNEALPLGYMGDPSDAARASGDVFLASDLSTYLTAQTIVVDGGNVLR